MARVNSVHLSIMSDLAANSQIREQKNDIFFAAWKIGLLLWHVFHGGGTEQSMMGKELTEILRCGSSDM